MDPKERAPSSDGILVSIKETTMRKQKTNPPTIGHAHEHGVDVGAVAGELAGALVGSVAGPAGAVAGMVIGSVAGGLAGKVLDDEARRTSAHDAELDDTIGVTHGDLGAPAAPAPAATPSNPQASGPNDLFSDLDP
jgi:phage tail tape-measure protein